MARTLPRLLTADALRNEALGTADSRAFRQEVLRRLASVLDFDWYVWALTDPITAVGIDPFARIPDRREVAGAIRLKYLEPTNRWTTLEGAASLGDRAGESRLWRELQHPAGVADVASVVLRRQTDCWGFLDLWSRARFAQSDIALLSALAPALADALRLTRSATFRGVTASTAPGGPAVVLLDDSLELVGSTTDVDAWLRRMLPTPDQSFPVPAAAYNVAAQLLAREAGVDSAEPVARMPASDGSWVRVSADRARPAPGIVVTIQPATVDERLDLFARAHSLTARERDVLRELSQGASTAQIARRLFISPYTVQDHVTAVFDKAGVRSRRELLARATGRAFADSPG